MGVTGGTNKLASTLSLYRFTRGNNSKVVRNKAFEITPGENGAGASAKSSGRKKIPRSEKGLGDGL